MMAHEDTEERKVVVCVGMNLVGNKYSLGNQMENLRFEFENFSFCHFSQVAKSYWVEETPCN